MSKDPKLVHTSGASLSAAGNGRAPGHPASSTANRTVARTIVETAACPQELKRGDQPWIMSDFQVQKMLGEGNMSSVVHCVCERSGAHVAVKMYHRDRMNSMNVKQVTREIEIHASLLHPNIVRLYAAFEDSDGIYLVQEFAARGDLYVELSRRGGYLPEPQVAKDVMTPFLSALTYMHSQGVLHRDIKPENIMLGADGSIKVGDFGLAINTNREKPVSRVGTLDYMPPEIVRLPYGNNAGARPQPEENGAAYGLPVDAWCAGVLAYELLIGSPPFEAESKESTYTRILKIEPNMPPHLSDQARDFIRQALLKEPSKRPTVHALLRHPWLRSYQRPMSMVVHETAGKAAASAGGTATLLAAAPVRAGTGAGSTAALGSGPEQGEAQHGGRAAGVGTDGRAHVTTSRTADVAAAGRGLKSLSFSSPMAGLYSDVKPSKRPPMETLMRTKAHGSLASRPDADTVASSFVHGSAHTHHTDTKPPGAGNSGAADKQARAVPGVVAETAGPLGERAAVAASVIGSSTGQPLTARHAAGHAAASVPSAAGEDLIRAVPRDGSRAAAGSAAEAGLGAGSAPGSQSGGKRNSFVAVIKRKLSGGLFASSAAATPDGGVEETSAAAAVSIAAASTAAAPARSGVGAICAVQAPTMQQLLSPQPQSNGLPLEDSLKRRNSGGRFLSALGKRFSGGSKRLGAAAAAAADMAADRLEESVEAGSSTGTTPLPSRLAMPAL